MHSVHSSSVISGLLSSSVISGLLSSLLSSSVIRGLLSSSVISGLLSSSVISGLLMECKLPSLSSYTIDQSTSGLFCPCVSAGNSVFYLLKVRKK